MRKFLKFITSKFVIVALFFFAQLFFWYYIVAQVSYFATWLQIVSAIINFLVVIWILSREMNASFKMGWIILVLAIPIAGSFFYFVYYGLNFSTRKRNRALTIIEKNINHMKKFNTLKSDAATEKLLVNNFKLASYQNTNSKFIPNGNTKFKLLLSDLKKAEKFILLEYFIIADSKIWNQIQEILFQKVSEGLEVKLLYDDFGSSAKLPSGHLQFLRKKGLDVHLFNRMKISLNFAQNYRSHRKIVVIDGNIAYTGGINLADEYENTIARYGYWADTAIRLEGEAVWGLTLTFFENWSFTTKQEYDLTSYRPTVNIKSTDIIVPLSDSPVADLMITKEVLVSMFSQAKNTILITTPYLIVNPEIISSLKTASLRGVDVSIVIPSIPDKKLVYMVTKSYIPELIHAGIKVYKFLPGFMHSKLYVCDDQAVIGTSNLDFRSLYLHFENNIWLYKSQTVMDIENYIMDAIKNSNTITIREIRERNIFYRTMQAVLKVFSTLM